MSTEFGDLGPDSFQASHAAPLERKIRDETRRISLFESEILKLSESRIGTDYADCADFLGAALVASSAAETLMCGEAGLTFMPAGVLAARRCL